MDGQSKRHSYAVIKDGFKAFKNKSEPGVHSFETLWTIKVIPVALLVICNHCFKHCNVALLLFHQNLSTCDTGITCNT